jgi:REP element-mobilizing transposase RayT
MPQSLVKNLIHLVFGTKHRRPWIAKGYREALFAYQAGIFQEWESPALVIGGVEDHVHALFALSRNHPLKKVVEEVKKGSSKWMKADGPRNPEFRWQAGYAAFSVSQSNLDQVRRYIEDQEEHHRKMTFQDELRAFFRRHGIEFDERYAWDGTGPLRPFHPGMWPQGEERRIPAPKGQNRSARGIAPGTEVRVVAVSQGLRPGGFGGVAPDIPGPQGVALG